MAGEKTLAWLDQCLAYSFERGATELRLSADSPATADVRGGGFVPIVKSGLSRRSIEFITDTVFGTTSDDTFAGELRRPYEGKTGSYDCIRTRVNGVWYLAFRKPSRSHEQGSVAVPVEDMPKRDASRSKRSAAKPSSKLEPPPRPTQMQLKRLARMAVDPPQTDETGLAPVDSDRFSAPQDSGRKDARNEGRRHRDTGDDDRPHRDTRDDDRRYEDAWHEESWQEDSRHGSKRRESGRYESGGYESRRRDERRRPEKRRDERRRDERRRDTPLDEPFESDLLEVGDDFSSAPKTSADVSWLDTLFKLMMEHGASDMHLCARSKPILRIDGDIRRVTSEPELKHEDLLAAVMAIAPERNRREFRETNDTDFSYELDGVGRFRANAYMDRKGVSAVFRAIPTDLLTLDQLGLPESVTELCHLTSGLVLVTGPTGSGKTTTLNGLIDYINETQPRHVITLEDPIEFVHMNKRCLINQREIGVHTTGFARALRAALREDPDILLVGELRDLETVEIAIETAETGHLVFATTHTRTAVSTVDRIIDKFPPERQNQVRVMLSASLRGVIAQTLCRKNGGGRIAVVEVLLHHPALANLIREGKTYQIPSLMQTKRGDGMVTLNDSLLKKVIQGYVTPSEAILHSPDPPGLAQDFAREGIALEEEIDAEVEAA